MHVIFNTKPHIVFFFKGKELENLQKPYRSSK